MVTGPPDLSAILHHIEDALVSVGVLVAQAEIAALGDVVPEADLRLRAAYRLAEGVQRWLLLQRAPVIEAYDPRDLPRMLSGTVQLANLLPPAQDAPNCQGDLTQVVHCLKLLSENVHLEGDGVFRASMPALDTPCVLITLDGDGLLPAELRLEEGVSVTWETFAGAWERATAGGTFTRNGGRMLLMLEGDGAAELAPPAAFDRAWRTALDLVRGLRSWRGATGHYEPGMVSLVEMHTLYTACVHQSLTAVRLLRDDLAA